LKSYETEPRDGMPASSPNGENMENVENGEMVQDQADAERVEGTARPSEPVVPDAANPPQDELVSFEEPRSDLDISTEDEDDEQPRRRIFSPPTRQQVFDWLPFWGIILLGAILRFWGLGDKPLHHDESLHAYFSLKLMQNDLQNWASCFNTANAGCYHYDPLLHGPFQFHAIALVYQISQWLGAPDHGVNTTTVRIAAATLGSVIVGLPYFLRNYLGRIGSLLACFLLAISPSMVYFSRFAREDIYMACFTLLLVVAVGRYIHTRKTRWIVIAAAAFALSYATKEATFLTVLIFGSFLGALLVWEVGVRIPLRSRIRSENSRYFPRTCGLVTLLIYFLVLAPIAKFFFGWVKTLSIYVTDPKNVNAANAYVQNLKNVTVATVPWVGIILGIFVLVILVREMLGRSAPVGRRGLATKLDPDRQPVLDTILTMPWTHWFFALLCAWTIFLVLFTALFTDIPGGIGNGIWQGLYYWLQQEQVDRGGQPWYYYLLLIPLYEQVGLVFGLVGVVRSLLRPTRFRLFMVYWFVGNVFIYSWAAEKMPWLMIHMTMPMMILAAIGLEPGVVRVVDLVKSRWQRSTISAKQTIVPVAPARPKVGVSAGVAIFSCVLGVLLLLPTLQNMYQVTYVHYADGPHEMMIYVQTTKDVNALMARVDMLDQKLDGGNHQLAIGLTSDATWPLIWYLRDYPNTCLDYPQGCPTTAKNIPVIIVGGDNLYGNQSLYSADYQYHQYHMRTWWDEGYKPTPCVPSKTVKCDPALTWGGVGPLLWLSYGDNPPPNAKFDLGRAVSNVWQWWWQRKAIGSTDGTYDMGLFIRKDLGVTP